jgi:hypothetical protein
VSVKRYCALVNFPWQSANLSAAAATAAVCCLLANQCLAAGLVFEDFNVNPGWDQHNNRIVAAMPRTVTQNFGYRTTNHAGGTAGEIGGIVDRAPLEGAYYGQVIGPLSFRLAIR